MQDRLQELTEKIYQEGVLKAKDEADFQLSMTLDTTSVFTEV